MNLPNVASFIHYLNVWLVFLKQTKKDQRVRKYNELFCRLAAVLTKKLQFGYNSLQLSEFNFVDLDEDVGFVSLLLF